jgi:hypothetical protein
MDGQDLDRKDPITTPRAPESDERLLARYGTFSRFGGECPLIAALRRARKGIVRQTKDAGPVAAAASLSFHAPVAGKARLI